LAITACPISFLSCAILSASLRRLEDLLQLVVALQAAAQVRQLLPQLEQLAQRIDLLRDPVRREVVQALELQIDPDLARVRPSLSLFATVNERCGFMLFSTSSKLSGVTSTNLRSFSRGSSRPVDP
jgi:hypothetical protein